MARRTRILSSIAVAAVFLSASPASAQQGMAAYFTTYYSDATYQTEVGHRYWTGCTIYGYPTYQLNGTQTVYWQEELAGYCNGDREPIS